MTFYQRSRQESRQAEYELERQRRPTASEANREHLGRLAQSFDDDDTPRTSHIRGNAANQKAANDRLMLVLDNLAAAEQSVHTAKDDAAFLYRYGKWLMIAMGLVLGLAVGAAVERAMTQAVMDQIESEQ